MEDSHHLNHAPDGRPQGEEAGVPPRPEGAELDASGAARATILARRVAALEAALAIERRLRGVQEMANRAVAAQLAGGESDRTVPRPHAALAYDDDATIPVAPFRPEAARAQPAPPPAAARGQSQPQPQPSQRLRGAAAPAPAARSRHPDAAGAATPLALAPGFELFEYRIDAVLGQGGFGITYLATDVNLNVKVAVKEYLPGDYALRASDRSVAPRWPEDRDFYLNGLESFLVEARTLATFRHSNIVRVARFFEAHNTAYMVLEYERGQALKQWWEGHRDTPEQHLLGLLQPLLDGLALVHESGYLHRDIKPDNIYVRKEDGSLVLLDFGAARLTAGGARDAADVVTPGYAPGEQYAGGEQGPWTDIYALGATLYWMVTGAKPAPAPARQKGEAIVPALEAGRGRYSAPFLAAIDAALELDPARRPRTVAAFALGLFGAHAASLGLQEALRAGDAARDADGGHAGEHQRLVAAGRKAPLGKRLRSLAQSLRRPGSWPMLVKMTGAMMLAALLPMTITAYYNLHGSMRTIEAGELRGLESLAQSTAGRLAQLVGDSRNLANFLATDPVLIGYLRAPGAQRKAEVDAKLANLVRSNPDVHLGVLMDRDGLALVSSEPGVAGLNFKFREYFQQAMLGRPFVTGIIVGSTAGKPGVYYANPVFDERHAVIGVVVLRIKGAAIAAILDQVGAAGERVPFMIDGDGVLTHYPDERQLYRSLVPLSAERAEALAKDQRFGRRRITSVDMPELARALVGAAKAGHISYHSTLSGVDEYAGFAPVAGHNWVVGVSEPRTRFEAPLRRLFEHVLYSVALVGLVFMALAALFARSIVRPVARLTEAANALKDGDYERANIKVTSNDEIGRLARTFNVMIDVLRQRERERSRGKLGRGDRGGDGDGDGDAA